MVTYLESDARAILYDVSGIKNEKEKIAEILGQIKGESATWENGTVKVKRLREIDKKVDAVFYGCGGTLLFVALFFLLDRLATTNYNISVPVSAIIAAVGIALYHFDRTPFEKVNYLWLNLFNDWLVIDKHSLGEEDWGLHENLKENLGLDNKKLLTIYEDNYYIESTNLKKKGWHFKRLEEPAEEHETCEDTTLSDTIHIEGLVYDIENLKDVKKKILGIFKSAGKKKIEWEFSYPHSKEFKLSSAEKWGGGYCGIATLFFFFLIFVNAATNLWVHYIIWALAIGGIIITPFIFLEPLLTGTPLWWVQVFEDKWLVLSPSNLETEYEGIFSKIIKELELEKRKITVIFLNAGYLIKTSKKEKAEKFIKLQEKMAKEERSEQK